MRSRLPPFAPKRGVPPLLALVLVGLAVLATLPAGWGATLDDEDEPENDNPNAATVLRAPGRVEDHVVAGSRDWDWFYIRKRKCQTVRIAIGHNGDADDLIRIFVAETVNRFDIVDRRARFVPGERVVRFSLPSSLDDETHFWIRVEGYDNRPVEYEFETTARRADLDVRRKIGRKKQQVRRLRQRAAATNSANRRDRLERRIRTKNRTIARLRRQLCR